MRASAIVTSALILCAALAPARAQSDEDALELLVSEGRAAIAKKKYDEAERLLDRAIRENPRRIDAYVLRSSVHAVKKEYAAGVALLRRARGMAPGNVEVLTALGSQLVLGGNAAEGVPILERVVATDPARYEAHIVLATHHAAAKRWPEAIAGYEAYLRARPAELAGQDPARKVELGDAYLRSGDPGKARVVFAEVLEARKKHARARLGLIWATAAIDCRKAVPLFAQADEDGLGEKVPEVRLVEGQCALRLGKPQEGLLLAEKVLAARPELAGGHALKGEALAAGGDLAGARAALAEAQRREPGNVLHALRLARLERLAGEPEAAIARLEALEPPKSERRVHVTELAEAYLAAGRHADAIGELERVVEPDATMLAILGDAHLAGAAATPALEAFKRAAALDPASARARKGLEDATNVVAVDAIQAGDPAAAERILASLVEPGRLTQLNLGIARLAQKKDAVAPLEAAAQGTTDGVAWQLYGRALAAAGRMNDARPAFERAFELERKDRARVGQIARDVASVELAAGDPARAVAALERALREGATDPEVRTAYVVAARAAASRNLRSGSPGAALRLLEQAERQADRKGEVWVALRCEAALAAVLVGDRDEALVRLRELDKAKASCPFPAPADTLAVPILRALSEGAEAGQAAKALDRLDKLDGKARGAAADLLRDARRWLGLRAAADAWARGKSDQAKKHLAVVKKAEPRPSPEAALAEAVLDLDAGRVDAAIAALERLVDTLPEARVNLGIAHEKKGDAMRALELFEDAAEDGRLRFAPVKDWATAKRRVLGGAP